MICWIFFLLLLIPQDLLAKQLPQDPLSEELPQDLLAKQLPQDALAEKLPQDALAEQLQLPSVPGCKWDEEHDADASKYQGCVNNQVKDAGVIINAIKDPGSLDNVDSVLQVVQSALDIVGLLSPELGAVFGIAEAIFGGGSGDDTPPPWVSDIISRLDEIENHLDEIENDIKRLGEELSIANCDQSIQGSVSTITSVQRYYNAMFSDDIRHSRNLLDQAKENFYGNCHDLSLAVQKLSDQVAGQFMQCADDYLVDYGYMSKKFYRKLANPVLLSLVQGVRYLCSCEYTESVKSSFIDLAKKVTETLNKKMQAANSKWMTDGYGQLSDAMNGLSADQIQAYLETDGSFDHEYSVVTFNSTTRKNSDFSYISSGSNYPQEGMLVPIQPSNNDGTGLIGVIFYKWKNLTEWGKEVSAWTNPDHPGSCEAMCTTTDTHWYGKHTCGQHSCGDAWHIIRAPHDRGNEALNNDLHKAPGTAMMKVAHRDKKLDYFDRYVTVYSWGEKQYYSHPVINNSNSGNYNLMVRQIGPEPTEDGGYFSINTKGFDTKYYYAMFYPLKGSKAPCTEADRGDPIATGVGCCEGLVVKPVYKVDQGTATKIAQKCSRCTLEGGDPYGQPDHEGVLLPCCPGTSKVQHGSSFTCDSCTPEGGDPYGQPDHEGVFLPCCPGTSKVQHGSSFTCDATGASLHPLLWMY